MIIGRKLFWPLLILESDGGIIQLHLSLLLLLLLNKRNAPKKKEGKKNSLCVLFWLDMTETLDFKFLLKSKYANAPCIVEEGPNRLLAGGHLQGDARLAIFRFNADEVLEHPVVIKADRVSPFDLAASWRAYQDNLQPSTVRGIPDVSINSVPETGTEVHPYFLAVNRLFTTVSASFDSWCHQKFLLATVCFSCCYNSEECKNSRVLVVFSYGVVTII